VQLAPDLLMGVQIPLSPHLFLERKAVPKELKALPKRKRSKKIVPKELKKMRL
tara:strand:+ start:3796 stop:3954 length:159 start_codon:yes stop_codon:yes gene_type:complete